MSRITPRPGSDGTPTWTTVGGLVATLQRRWQKGTYLRAHAAGLAFDAFTALTCVHGDGWGMAWRDDQGHTLYFGQPL